MSEHGRAVVHRVDGRRGITSSKHPSPVDGKVLVLWDNSPDGKWALVDPAKLRTIGLWSRR